MRIAFHHGRPRAMALVTAASLCAAMLLACPASSPAQTAAPALAGTWGSTLYRAQITIAGTAVTGTFTAVGDASAPAGTIAGQLTSDRNGFTATWTQAIGGDTVTFSTWLRLAANGSVLNGYRFSSSGQPAAFSLHRPVGGTVPMPLGPEDLPKDATKKPVTASTPSPESTASKSSTSASPRTFTFDNPGRSALLARNYDADHFSIRLALQWTTPGSILDTVGINTAVVGSWCVIVDAEGTVTLQVYAPAHAGSTRNASGWHLLTSPVRTRPGEPVNLTVTRTPEQWSLSVAAGDRPRRSAFLALQVPAAGDLYLGDFPGDNALPASYRPVRGFTGTAELLSFLGRTR